jgi:hypothetical protein
MSFGRDWWGKLHILERPYKREKEGVLNIFWGIRIDKKVSTYMYLYVHVRYLWKVEYFWAHLS